MSAFSRVKRFDLHLAEFQRIVVSLPAMPVDAVAERAVVASQVATVQVGVMTTVVPPGTFELHCTRAWIFIVVLVASAELLAEMT